MLTRFLPRDCPLLYALLALKIQSGLKHEFAEIAGNATGHVEGNLYGQGARDFKAGPGARVRKAQSRSAGFPAARLCASRFAAVFQDDPGSSRMGP